MVLIIKIMFKLFAFLYRYYLKFYILHLTECGSLGVNYILCTDMYKDSYGIDTAMRLNDGKWNLYFYPVEIRFL